MNLDIKIPIGLMFSILGLILSIYGWVTGGDTEMYARSLGLNINVGIGLVMLVFGIFMLLAARSTGKKAR
jgi:hypothetical protein